MKYILNILEKLIGLTLMLSGFLKLNDPLGTQYKLQDYLDAVGLAGVFPEWTTLVGAILLAMTEFAIGGALVTCVKRTRTLTVATLFMLLMTLITVWLWLYNPITDCGCFGEAIRLTNEESLLKNVVIMLMLGLLWWKKQHLKPIFSVGKRWWTYNLLIILAMVLCVYSLYILPPLDFTPYHVGVNIRKSMEIPPGAPRSKYATTFILQKDGVQQEFTLDNYPDSTWEFVDSKTLLVEQGYEPPITDFLITSPEGDDITADILSYPGTTYMLISPHLEQASDGNFGKIEQLYEKAMDEGSRFICLTASGDRAIREWQDRTGAEYPCYNADATTLKTMIRSNPGIIILRRGVIMEKYSHNQL